jgi:chromosome segregation ATPase
VREKRDLRRQVDDQELELGAEIDTLKNKLQTQQEINTSESHSQMSRINELTEKLQRDAENYHNRAKDFRNKIARLEADLDDKQAELDRTKGAADLREKEILKALAEANTELNKVKAQLYDSED